MKIYLLETGHFRQDGEIVDAFTKLSDALAEFEHWKDVKKREAYTVVNDGVSEFDNTPGVICGFWAGPERGNICANGWRVREIEAK